MTNYIVRVVTQWVAITHTFTWSFDLLGMWIIKNTISSVPRATSPLNLVEWSLMMRCCYPLSHATFCSFGYMTNLSVQSRHVIFKGTFPENFWSDGKHYMFISKSCMTIKLVRMVTYYELLLPTWSCDLLIFWSRD